MAPSLEALPLELLTYVLRSISDLETLESVVLSCPTVYHAYLFDRYRILLEFILQQHEDYVDLAEAIAAIRSEGLYAVEPSSRAKIIAVLDCRRRSDEIQKLDSARTLSPHLPVNIKEIFQLLQLRKEASFFLQDYTTNLQCPTWMDSAKWSSKILPIKPSNTERKRLLRAYYRLQTYYNIFGHPERRSSDHPGRQYCNYWFGVSFSTEEVWRLFFATMPLWEVEEFACLSNYLYNRYEPVFKEISDDFTSYGKGFVWAFDIVLPSSIIKETTDLVPNRGLYFGFREGVASIGPRLLYKVLNGTYRERRDLIVTNLRNVPSPILFDLILPEFVYPLIYPADEKYDPDDLESALPKLPPLEQPNLAWSRYWWGGVLASREYFMDMPLCFGCNKSRWDWGYAIWDTEKLLEWQAPLERPMLSIDDGSSNEDTDFNTDYYSSPSP